MLQRGRPRLLPALALTAVLALALTPPAGAAGWTVWRPEGIDVFAGLFARLLDRLELAPPSGVVLKCSDQGSSIDPNGCSKTQPGGQKSQLQKRLRGARSQEAY